MSRRSNRGRQAARQQQRYRIQADLVKRSLPTGSVVLTAEQVAGLASQQAQTGSYLRLGRDGRLQSVPFGPGVPFIPSAVNTRRADGRADPRRNEYDASWNLQITARPEVPFDVLRGMADRCDLARRCIEVVKAAICGMDWDFALTARATEQIQQDTDGSAHAMKQARDKFQPAINRAVDFWMNPDPINGLGFKQWLRVALEEVLVIDALTVYPVQDRGGRLASLTVLDGGTIKPLIDEFGFRPQAPYPAFQQILYGFPRTEYLAAPDPDQEFTADQLFYSPMHPRARSPYGNSPTERALPLLDLYLKRQAWVRSEFTDGVVPDMIVKFAAEAGLDPQQLPMLEEVFNDYLSGQNEQRRRAKFLPPGAEPVAMPGAAEKWSAVFDEWLLTSITGHYGVLPTQLGQTPRSGLGGKGHQEGEQDSAETLGLRPTVDYLIEVVNALSQRMLGMPQEITLVLTDGTSKDETAQASRRQIELFSAQTTVNQINAETGKPLLDMPEADMPFLAVGTNIVPLQMLSTLGQPHETQLDPVTGQPAPADPAAGPPKPGEKPALGQGAPRPAAGGQPPAGQGGQAGKPAPAAAAAPAPAGGAQAKAAELAAFVKWAGRPRARLFDFTAVDEDTAGRLNALAKVDQGRAAAEARAMLGKASAPRPAGHGDRVLLVSQAHAPRIAAALLRGALTAKDDPSLHLRGSVKSVDPGQIQDWAALAYEVRRLIIEAYTRAVLGTAGDLPAGVVPSWLPALDANVGTDWDAWSPGWADAAAKVADGGLSQLLDAAEVTIRGATGTALDRLESVLADALARGQGADWIERQLRDTFGSQAETIARTETARAMSAATRDTYRANGVTAWDWVPVPDPCPICEGLSLGGPYSLSDDMPPAHPNCLCAAAPVLPDVDTTGLTMTAEADVVKRGIPTQADIDAAVEYVRRLPDDPAKPKGHFRSDLIWPERAKVPVVPPAAWGDAQVKLVDVADLVCSTKHLKKPDLIWHLQHLGQAMKPDEVLPQVVKVDGDRIVFDGHHRLAAWLLTGVPKTAVWQLKQP